MRHTLLMKEEHSQENKKRRFEWETFVSILDIDVRFELARTQCLIVVLLVEPLVVAQRR